MALARLKTPSALRRFLHSRASAGLFLMAMAALALVLANSALAESYGALLHAYVGPLSLVHWINYALMAGFFLLVGLEIKREMLDGQLSSWSRCILRGVAALGGMVAPALVFYAFNTGNTARGWAIPAATDIAFALGAISLLGAVLCILVFRSGIHATLAGGVLALTIPMDVIPSQSDADATSPLHRLEHALHIPVGFLIVPLIALADPLLQSEEKLGILAGSFISGLLGFIVLRFSHSESNPTPV